MVVEAHDALATKSDIHELRGVVKDMADTQRATEKAVVGLADARRQEVRILLEGNLLPAAV